VNSPHNAGETSTKTVVFIGILTALITATATIIATGKWNSLSDFIGLKPNSKNMARALQVQNTKTQMVFQVFQTLDNGALCSLNGDINNLSFVYGLTGVADNEKWTAPVYSAGLYRYDTKLGITKSVRAYATTLELALDHSNW
jgi:hypothetical protein